MKKCAITIYLPKVPLRSAMFNILSISQMFPLTIVFRSPRESNEQWLAISSITYLEIAQVVTEF